MTLFWDTIEAQIGLRFNPSPNKPYFCNRTILIDLIKAISCPDLTLNRQFVTIPGKTGRKKAAIGRLWALYGAQFGRILPNKSIYCPYLHANRIGRFYGRIFGHQNEEEPVPDQVPVIRGSAAGNLPVSCRWFSYC